MSDRASLDPRIPVATYRLQFNHFFKFEDARQAVHYLHELGVSDLYCSPYFKAAPGSLHGYDITDPTLLNPEIGTPEEYEAFVQEIRRYHMGQILDIVPNHMCIFHSDNVWWMDVLENGPSSPYTAFFDVDWRSSASQLRNKVLIPVLGDQYGKVLDAQELTLAFDKGAFILRYYDHTFPILPETYPLILNHRMETLNEQLRPESPERGEFARVVTVLGYIPRYTETHPADVAKRYEVKERAKSSLRSLYDRSVPIQSFIDQNVREFNGEKGNERSFDLLDGLLRRQVYRLSFWRVAAEEINYRRFFDINSLGAVRMEDHRVFESFHRLILLLIKDRKVTGLRVDHPDGLYNPAAYFGNLQRACFFELQRNHLDRVAREVDLGYGKGYVDDELDDRYDAIMQHNPAYKPFYIVGEKILTKTERMPEEWPIFSTTGYVFLNSVNGIFIDTRSARAFDRVYRQFSRSERNFQDEGYESRKLVIQTAMSGEINTLGRYLDDLSENDRHTRDFTRNSLTDALVEIIANFPVYRTYIDSYEVKDRDRQYIETAVARARRRNPGVGAEVYDFVHDVLVLRFPRSFTDKERRQWLSFVMRFQQLTAPIMAKGVEDTAFYRYNRLISLNEVGGNPEKFGTTLETFHGQNIERAKYWPHALIATSTHDTKMGEDVKARINVLTEMPDRWRDRLHRWHQLNRKRRIIVDGEAVPDRNDEYRLYQTLLGSWPEPPETSGTDFEGFVKRIKDHSIKAAREAKVHTSWINPNGLYEEAFTLFIDAILSAGRPNRFLNDFEPFQRIVSLYGIYTSLSQTLLKMAAPGVPDFYQGTEFWYYRLADPDNRGAVDLLQRARSLVELRRREGEVGLRNLAIELSRHRTDGRIKLYVIEKTLNYRAKNREIFDSGEYLPLEAGGPMSDHICAFARRTGRHVIACVPRLTAALLPDPTSPPLGAEVWGGTRLYVPFAEEGTTYRNIFTGTTILLERREGELALPLGEIFGDFPVALLGQESSTA
ncbi:MAG TPA: malto-oligosyltrehalose synthase [Deltaproteobacteria bacterium]|nr:malto-oligosyltrehalose synthase [Deltaproteobacteria bacterium]